MKRPLAGAAFLFSRTDILVCPIYGRCLVSTAYGSGPVLFLACDPPVSAGGTDIIEGQGCLFYFDGAGAAGGFWRSEPESIFGTVVAAGSALK